MNEISWKLKPAFFLLLTFAAISPAYAVRQSGNAETNQQTAIDTKQHTAPNTKAGPQSGTGTIVTLPDPLKNKERGESTKNTDELNYERKTADWTEKLTKVTNSLANYTLFLAFTTLLLVAVGFAQFLMFRRQLNVMREEAFDTRKSVEASLENSQATKSAAQAAVDANILSRRIFVANSRPWLTIENVDFVDHFVLRKEIVESNCIVSLRNIGKFPAELISVSVKFLFEDGYNATALKQHISWYDLIIGNVEAFRENEKPTTFAMHPNEVVKRKVSADTHIMGELKRAKLFLSVITTYRNPGATPWCASARLYKVAHKAPTSVIEDFDFGGNFAPFPNAIDAEIIYEGNVTV